MGCCGSRANLRTGSPLRACGRTCRLCAAHVHVIRENGKNMMSNFETHTVVNGIEAESVLDALLGHLAEHEFVALRVDDAWILDYESAQIKFAAKGDTLTARITAPTSESL